jgi:hypothetical protein
MLSTLVIANFRSAQTRTANQSFNQQLFELFQRAANYAQTGRGVYRCADNNTKVCTAATQTNDCGPSAPCDVTPPVGGWGVHYTAVNNPSGQPASFRVYGDRADAECTNGRAGKCSNNAAVTCYSNDDCGYGNTCIFPAFGSNCVYRCQAKPNRRFDLYYGQGGPNNTESRSCNTIRFCSTVSSAVGLNCESNGFQDDVVDTSPLGSLTVPANVFVKVYSVSQYFSQLATDIADINFSLTSGKANHGRGAAVSARDPLYASSYNSQALHTRVCTSTAASGPYHQILIFASGLVVDAGDNFSTC